MMLLVLITVFCLFICGPSHAKIKVVGAFYEPFFYKTRTGFYGFDIDILNIFSLRTGEEFEIEVTSFDKALKKVAKGEADMAIGAIYVTPERKKLFNFTVPYLETGLVLVVPYKSTINREVDLRGRRICVKIGATGEKRAERLKNKYHWIIVRKRYTLDCFRAVVRGEADALFNDYYNSLYLINRLFKKKLRIVRGFLGPVILEKNYIAFPVAKDRTDLLRKLNLVITELKREEDIKFLENKWFAIPLSSATYIRIYKYSLFGVFLFISIFLAVFFTFYFKSIKRREKELERFLENIKEPAIGIKDENVVFKNSAAAKLLQEVDLSELTKGRAEEIWLDAKDKSLSPRLFIRFTVPVGEKTYLLIADISDCKQTEEEYETLKTKLLAAQTIDGLGKISYQLAEDFNNIMNQALTLVELALIEVRKKNLKEAEKQLEEAKKQILGFSDFSRKLISFAKHPFKELTVIDVNSVILECKDVLEKVLGRIARLEIDLGNVKPATAYHSGIFLVLFNLCVNSREAFVESGRPAQRNVVRIRTYMTVVDEDELKDCPWASPGSYVVIEFADNGPGIPPEMVKKIFEPFFSLQPDSTGMGLYIVREVVRHMKGFVRVRTELGEGTTFLIFLPAS